MDNSKSKYLFYAITPKGFSLKVAIDTISSVIKSTNFSITEDGIFHRGADGHNKILVDVEFLRDDFQEFYCEESLEFCVNMRLLCHVIKNIKRKNPIKLFITRKNPSSLGISIYPPETQGGIRGVESETSHVVITLLNEHDDSSSGANAIESIELPENYIDGKGNTKNVYGHAKVIPSPDFQKVKNTWGNSKTVVTRDIKIKICGSGYIMFRSNSEVVNSSIQFGEIPPDTDMYTGVFDKGLLMPLIKLKDMGKQLMFYAPAANTYPLKVKIRGELLGTIVVYIKDNKCIELEKVTTKKISSQASAVTIKKSRRRKRK